MRLKVDKSWCSAVAACACGWRAIASDRGRVLVLAAAHERAMHPDDRHARAMLCAHRKRHPDSIAG